MVRKPVTLWEDADLLAVAKPCGLVVDSGGRSGDDLVSLTGCFAFHRLDRETSGIVLLGKSRRWAREITALFEEKRIRKAYMAVVDGAWTLSRVDSPIEDRAAATTFRRLASGRAATWIEALPKTGRTHQIRIHCAESGHAILGDQRYGPHAAANAARADGAGVTGGPAGAAGAAGGLAATSLGHALHAYRLDFRHPSNGETVSLKSAPIEWRETWLKGIDFEPTWKKVFG